MLVMQRQLGIFKKIVKPLNTILNSLPAPTCDMFLTLTTECEKLHTVPLRMNGNKACVDMALCWDSCLNLSTQNSLLFCCCALLGSVFFVWWKLHSSVFSYPVGCGMKTVSCALTEICPPSVGFSAHRVSSQLMSHFKDVESLAVEEVESKSHCLAVSCCWSLELAENNIVLCPLFLCVV